MICRRWNLIIFSLLSLVCVWCVLQSSLPGSTNIAAVSVSRIYRLTQNVHIRTTLPRISNLIHCALIRINSPLISGIAIQILDFIWSALLHHQVIVDHWWITLLVGSKTNFLYAYYAFWVIILILLKLDIVQVYGVLLIVILRILLLIVHLHLHLHFIIHIVHVLWTVENARSFCKIIVIKGICTRKIVGLELVVWVSSVPVVVLIHQMAQTQVLKVIFLVW